MYVEIYFVSPILFLNEKVSDYSAQTVMLTVSCLELHNSYCKGIGHRWYTMEWLINCVTWKLWRHMNFWHYAVYLRIEEEPVGKKWDMFPSTMPTVQHAYLPSLDLRMGAKQFPSRNPTHDPSKCEVGIRLQMCFFCFCKEDSKQFSSAT